MTHPTNAPLAALLAAVLTTAVPAFAADQKEPAVADPQAQTADDPYLWLEDVTGDKALGWAKQQNARTDAELAATPGFAQLR